MLEIWFAYEFQRSLDAYPPSFLVESLWLSLLCFDIRCLKRNIHGVIKEFKSNLGVVTDCFLTCSDDSSICLASSEDKFLTSSLFFLCKNSNLLLFFSF